MRVLLSCHLASVLSLAAASLWQPSLEVWTNGCGGRSTVTDPSSSVSPPPKPEDRAVNDSLVLILLMSRTAARICDELNNTIISELNKTDIQVNLPGESQLETLLTGRTPGQTKQIQDVLGKAVTRMSRIGLFLELARNDTMDYSGKITELERKVMEIVCQIYQLMKDINAEVTSHVTRDLVTSEYRDGLDISGRHRRNLLITKGAKAMLCKFAERLQNLTQMRQLPPLHN
ncbi:uncharacterized protein LOC124252944 [Haliotis rubra]|uniref:uncharacterized protein LOC124252944 n=1 Tax=Haliotis rubra TaxID=36100 RepID=UPI001EE55FE0|nr:uncharacterized protein LOC124252944 [Haliotis rubra]